LARTSTLNTPSARVRADACTICGHPDYADGLSFTAGGGVCGPCVERERAEWQANRPNNYVYTSKYIQQADED